jgi:hypothetical protein
VTVADRNAMNVEDREERMMKRNRASLGVRSLVVSAILVSATLQAREASTQREAPSLQTFQAGRTCTAVWVRSAGPSSPSEKKRVLLRPLTFSATEILDLELVVIVPSKNAGKDMEIKLYTPKGQLYQTLKVGADASASASGADQARGRWYETVTARLPVAGTTIVNNSLYGVWKAEAYFEGSSSPCTRARSFSIKP